MGRTRRQTASNSLVASAARVRGGRGFKAYSQIANKGGGWQSEAWTFYRTIGEFRYSCDWVGNTLSKAVLFASIETNGKAERVEKGVAAGIIEQLFGDADGKAEMLRLLGIHLTVAGECWIVGWDQEDEDGLVEERWEVVAMGKLRQSADSEPYYINNQQVDADPDDVIVARIWRPDPEDPMLATAPSRAVLPILGEIYKLTEHVAAQVDSRLAGAGVFLVPSEMSFPPPPSSKDADGKDVVVQRQANSAEELSMLLQETMAMAIEDRSDPSARVPIIITAPAEAIAAVQYMTFWTELDQHAIELRNEAIRRLALGMDMPPEVLQGIAESNHWSAWQADESAIKSHTEPLLKIITTSLAKEWLRPALRLEESIPLEDVHRYSIKADTSEMRIRPNRSKEALELYDRGELSGEALLRETGFDSDDAMSNEERAFWFLRKVAGGSTTPDLVATALEMLNVLKAPTPAPTPAEVGQEARPAPSLQDHEERDIPDREVGERRKEARREGRVPSSDIARRASLVAASEQVVLRAMERAGNKLKNKMQGRPTVAAVDLYRVVPTQPGEFGKLLDDAWAQVPAIAARHGLETGVLEKNLDAYCRMLLSTKSEHTYEGFEEYLSFALTMEEAA